MRDPEDDDVPPRDDRGFTSSNFRRKLGEGLAGLLDPEGALGKGKEIVTGVTQATKNEVVRMVSAEVRQFLDGMDTVDLLQRVIAGLVIDVKAEIRFSIDPEGQLKSTVKTKESAIKTKEPAARTGEGKSGEGKSGEGKSGEGKSGEGKDPGGSPSG